MVNQQIAAIFNEMADLLEIKGENPFRIRSYRRAAQNIEGLPKDAGLMTEKKLLEVPGIGQDLSAKIREYISTGRITAFEDLKKDVPEDLAILLSVPSLGPDQARHQ